MKLLIPLLLPLVFITSSIGQTTVGKSFLYLNQEPPGTKAELFAPGIVSKMDRYEFGSVFSKDGKQFFYSVQGERPHIEMIEYKNNKWSQAVEILISDKFGYNDPFLSPDERRLYFISDQAMDGKGDKKDIDIWYVEKEANGWSKPINAGRAINSPNNEYYISFTMTGTIYYASNKHSGDIKSKQFDIFSSVFLKNTFQLSKKLGGTINTEHYEGDVFVSLKEDYLIFCAERPDGHGRGDLYISFKDRNGEWGVSKNMGPDVNSDGYEYCPFVTADGKYLFFTRKNDIYWVDAKVIPDLSNF